MVDHSAGDVRVFETGSIMLYLCEHYDTEHKLLPAVSDRAVGALSKGCDVHVQSTQDGVPSA
jgi:glutathione S-transferase